MNYLDTDVLIHSMVNQNANMHLRVSDLLEEMIIEEIFLISWLSIQEVGFVLAKLGQAVSDIEINLNSLISSSPVQYGLPEFRRAMTLAQQIGFRDFNDCLHTAIAEQYCSDLYTCNYKDFKRIEPLTFLNIHYV